MSINPIKYNRIIVYWEIGKYKRKITKNKKE